MNSKTDFKRVFEFAFLEFMQLPTIHEDFSSRMHRSLSVNDALMDVTFSLYIQMYRLIEDEEVFRIPF